MRLETFLQDNVPQTLVLGLAFVGSSYLAGIIFSYVRLLASLFVLSGTNVRLLPASFSTPFKFSVIAKEDAN
jgi:hypothetical protein